MRVVIYMFLLVMPALAWADTFIDMQVDVVSNDNVSIGNHLPDRVPDNALVLSTRLGFPMPLGDGMLTPTVSVEHSEYQTYPLFNRTWMKAGLTFKDKFGIGNVPWYTLGAVVGYKYSADDLRDATYIAVKAGLGKHWGENLTLNFDYTYDIENAVHEVFDTKRHTLSLSGDYLLSDDWMLLFDYTYVQGAVAANMYPNSHIVADANNVFVVDPVFGPGRSAYKLEGERLDKIGLGVNYYVDEQSAVEFNYAYWQGSRLVGFKSIWSNYYETIYTLSYIVSY